MSAFILIVAATVALEWVGAGSADTGLFRGLCILGSTLLIALVLLAIERTNFVGQAVFVGGLVSIAAVVALFVDLRGLN